MTLIFIVSVVLERPALYRGQTDRTYLSLTFSLLLAMVMTYTDWQEDSRTRPVTLKDRIETNGQTDRGDYITSLTNAISVNVQTE